MPTDEPVYCARHPREQTAVRCATCGTPICPRCMVTTPVGFKCRDCGTSRKSALYQIRPERFLLAAVAALLAGAGASLLGGIGFFAIFIATAYGYAAGTVVLRASGMKRGSRLEVLTGAAMVIGALAARLLPALVTGGHITLTAAALTLADPFFWIAVALSAACAVSRIRYL